MTYSQMQKAKSKTIDSILLSIESEIKKTYRFGRDNITGLVKDAYAKHEEWDNFKSNIEEYFI